MSMFGSEEEAWRELNKCVRSRRSDVKITRGVSSYSLHFPRVVNECVRDFTGNIPKVLFYDWVTAWVRFLSSLRNQTADGGHQSCQHVGVPRTNYWQQRVRTGVILPLVDICHSFWLTNEWTCFCLHSLLGRMVFGDLVAIMWWISLYSNSMLPEITFLGKGWIQSNLYWPIRLYLCTACTLHLLPVYIPVNNAVQYDRCIINLRY